MSIGYIKQSAASVPTPPVGEQNTFIDSADDKLKKKLDDGSIVDLEAFSSGSVASFEGRTGVVLAQSGDYLASEITNTPSGNISATNVQAALAELDSEKAPISHVGSTGVSEHGLATGLVAGFMSTTDKTKLDGIASGATANDTDANLKNRANHTGTQVAATISDFDTAAKTAVVDDAIVNGVLDKAPSQNSVFDALALKSDMLSLTGEVTASGSGAVNAVISNAAVIAKLLTGLTECYGQVLSTDSIVTAICKLAFNAGMHAQNINQDMELPANYSMIRSTTRLNGTSKIVLGLGSNLKIV